MIDVIIIGGSYAGLSAALQLGRTRSQVLILDAGQRRNRFARHSHGFLGHDGQSPEAIIAKARAEVLAYPTVTLREGLVTEIQVIPGGFSARTGNEIFLGKRVIVASGIKDELPAVPGLQERWGKTVFHCPYCHGYELHQGRLGVLASNLHAVHSALLISHWAGKGQTVLFLNEHLEPDEEQMSALRKRGIQVERTPVAAIEGEEPKVELRLSDGRSIALDGLFVMPKPILSTPFAQQLGCELETGLLGSFFKTDATKETTVPGVFACGDVALAMSTVALAVADGAMAGFSAHKSLVFSPELPTR
jgi:thioredoxin reductase